MSHRRTAHPAPSAPTHVDNEPLEFAWIVYAVGLLLVGGLTGYVLSVLSTRTSVTSAVATSAALPSAPVSGAGLVDEQALQAYRNVLAKDARNVEAAIGAGNLLYDARRYSEAVPFYQQALAVNANNINVSTDLGTALWYLGRADEALAQYAASLAIDANHAQTLFNMGIVKADGKQDHAGAISAWETLLATNPSYPNADQVRRLISEARSKLGAAD